MDLPANVKTDAAHLLSWANRDKLARQEQGYWSQPVPDRHVFDKETLTRRL